jgi:hypothetical protein
MTKTFSIYVAGIFQGNIQAADRTAASHFARAHHGPNAMVMGWSK